MADITVNFINNNRGVTVQGFGIPLVISTKKDVEYKIVDIGDGLGTIEKDFLVSTDAYKIVQAISMQEPKPTQVAIFGKDLTSVKENKEKTLTEALDSLIADHNDFYRICIDDTTLNKIASDFAEANEKIFIGLTDKKEKALEGKSRTLLCYKADKERLDGGIAGFCSPRIAGSYTLKFKQINGITPDKLNGSNIAELEQNNINAYIKSYGTGGMSNGLATDGSFIDQVESRDYIKSQIISEIAYLLKNSEKIPYDNDGIQSIYACVVSALNKVAQEGIIAKENGKPLFKVTYNTLDKIPKQDRTKRIVSGIKFKYQEAGAVHGVAITGEVVGQLA